MPNWCDNSCTIVCTEDTLDELKKTKLYSLYEKFHNDENWRYIELFDFFIPSPNGEWDCEFSYNNWGTKWDVQLGQFLHEPDRFYMDVGEYTAKLTLDIAFQTAWGPPDEFYKYLTGLGYSVDAHYYEGGCMFIGRYSDGVNVYHNLGDITEYKNKEEYIKQINPFILVNHFINIEDEIDFMFEMSDDTPSLISSVDQKREATYLMGNLMES